MIRAPMTLMAVMAVLVLPILSGCSSAATSAGGDPFGGAGGQQGSELRIVVENRYLSEVTLFARSSGRRIRMGTVGGLSAGDFSVQWPGPSNLQVEIQSLDGSRYLTPGVYAGPGDAVQLVVESQLRYSRLR